MDGGAQPFASDCWMNLSPIRPRLDQNSSVVFGKNVPNGVSQVTSASLIGTYVAGVFTMADWMVLLNQLHPGAV
jgi:hypothetical protein